MSGAITIVAWVAIASGIGSAALLGLDTWRRGGQHMAIMNVVWPLTALYSGPLGLWLYWKSVPSKAAHAMNGQGHAPPSRAFWHSAALATTHCGSGCTLGDLCAETFTALVPLTLLGQKIFGTWILDFAAAFGFGIAFQYFTIRPMRNLSRRDGLLAALKADAASLSAWQVGMYGWMAFVVFVVAGHELPKGSPVFWFMMQVAMLVGFLTSYPVNWWMLRTRIKEPM